ncbi:MAG: heme exporter protein CcmD [Rhodobacteraceae bacterium]|nr:heme exporter protein CcmD [Paracoccaceae bacterium]
MMPDLGQYAGWVLAAYGVTLLGLGAIVVASLVRAGRVRRQLEALEARRSPAPPREVTEEQGTEKGTGPGHRSGGTG